MLVMKNKATYIRRDLASRILKLYFDEKLIEEVDKLPIQLHPRDGQSYRCCVYKDRAMIRYRILGLLGISIEEDDNEFLRIADFVPIAESREKIEDPVLTVIDMACQSCVRGKYHVTELCRGCVARPCQTNCPVNAIAVSEGRAHIDMDKCINCGKCQTNCPYNAIVKVPVPCEEACPVGAIIKEKNGRAKIDFEKCTHCGRCSRSCPFGAVIERSQIIDVARRLKDQSVKTVAMIAPSIAGQFPGSVEQLYKALLAVGFDEIELIAGGADEVARLEAAEFVEKISGGQGLMGTSCCPAYVTAVEKHAPEFKPFVSHTPTPMAITAKRVKEKDPNAVSVFIGPCVAKRHEGILNPHVDLVLTFEDLGAFFMALGVDVSEMEADEESLLFASGEGWRFAVTGGVGAAVIACVKDQVEVKPYSINGLNKKGINILKTAAKGKMPYNLYEVMNCEGGCVAGPGILVGPEVSQKVLKTFADRCKPINEE